MKFKWGGSEMIVVRNRYDGEFICEGATVLKAVEQAVQDRISLSCANLDGADLRGANLVGADMKCVTLKGANLEGADLSGVDLCISDLRDAKLAGADFIDTNIDGVQFEGSVDADLKRAIVDKSRFYALDRNGFINTPQWLRDHKTQDSYDGEVRGG